MRRCDNTGNSPEKCAMQQHSRACYISFPVNKFYDPTFYLVSLSVGYISPVSGNNFTVHCIIFSLGVSQISA